MKCMYSENDLALYVEGDLAGSRLREIEAHVATCAVCHELAAELRESQAVFQTLRQDTVSAAALASLRNRVLADVVGGNVKAPWGRWVYAVAGSVFVAVIGVGLAWYLSRPVPVQHIVESNPLPPSASVPLKRGPVASATTSTVSKSNKKAGRHDPNTATTSINVPLTEGDGRLRRQGVALDEIPAEPPKPKQLVVKLLTDDPNIVIYWLVDQTGGSL